MNLPELLLTEGQAARILSVSCSWLQKRRGDGTGPRWIRLGRRAVRYRKADLDDYVRSGQAIRQ